MRLLLFLIVILLLTGCKSPSKKIAQTEEKIAKVQAKIDTSSFQLDNYNRSYLYGADYSLSLDPNPNIYSSTAKDFTSRGLFLMGHPTAEESLKTEEITKKLVSNDKKLIKKGKKELDNKDEAVKEINDALSIYKNQLFESEQELRKINQETAIIADVWHKFKLWGKILSWGAIAGIVLSIISRVLPAPYGGSIISIIAMPLGLLVKALFGLFPHSRQYAKVVPSKDHDEAIHTLEKLILSVDELKKTKPTAYAEIKPILKDKTDTEISRPTITRIKKDCRLA